MKNALLIAIFLLLPGVSLADTFFPGTLVYSGNRGNTIDLSSTIGSVPAIVVLRVRDDSGSNSNVGLRATGVSGTFTPASTHVGGSNALLVGNRSLYLTGVTASDGRIDLVSTGSGAISVWLESYSIEGSSSSAPMDLYFGFIIFILITFFLTWLFRTKKSS